MATNRNRLGSFTRLRDTDFPAENKTLVAKLAGLLNTPIERIFSILNSLSIREEDQRSFTIVTNSSGIPVNSTTVSLKSAFISNRVSGVYIKKVTNLTSNSNLTGAPFITWSQSKNSIVINHITGLIANETYQIDIEIVGESG